MATDVFHLHVVNLPVLLACKHANTYFSLVRARCGTAPGCCACVQVDECAEKVCVLGWGPNCLMLDLIKELDHGLSALPKGSEVVFVNMHNPHDSLGQALQHVTLENVQVGFGPPLLH